MNESKNSSSKLDALFENARKEQPVMSLNEVSTLIQNPSAFPGKKESNTWKWFGTFLFIGLCAFGIFFLFNNDSSTDVNAGSSVAVTNNMQPNSNTVQANASVPVNENETAETSEKNDVKNASSENSLAETSKENKNTVAEKPVSAPQKPEPKAKTMTTHYAGDANISFSSGDKKVKMIISSSNEIEELKINNELISEENFKEHKNIIDEGLKLKNEKLAGGGAGSEKEQSLSAAKRNVMNAMMKELTADGLISSDKPFDFTLTGQDLFLDDEKQSAETFEKYKGVYEKVTGEKLPSKYNLHIKR